VVAAETILPGMEYVEGVVRLIDGMLLVHDLDTFLSLKEENALDDAMETWEGRDAP
jgi:purine-binding chemotaxis protein CheW